MLIDLARQLIADGRRDVALELNKAVRVLGHSLDAQTVIQKLEKKFNFKYNNSVSRRNVAQKNESEIEPRTGLTFWVIVFGLMILTLALSSMYTHQSQ